MGRKLSFLTENSLFPFFSIVLSHFNNNQKKKKRKCISKCVFLAVQSWQFEESFEKKKIHNSILKIKVFDYFIKMNDNPKINNLGFLWNK
jgi:hypothetical protein